MEPPAPATDTLVRWLLQEAKRIGDDFLALEKYVNLNYMVRAQSAWVHGTWSMENSCMQQSSCLVPPYMTWGEQKMQRD